MNEKYVLDGESFKALASETRIKILKSLGKRRMTLSELGKKIKLKNPTIKEHCEILEKNNLIKKFDEGRKWKYYELTKKGEQIVKPQLFEELKILVMLCFGIIIFSGIILTLLQGIFVIQEPNIVNTIDSFEINTMEDSDMGIEEYKTGVVGSNIEINYNIFSITIISVLVIGMLLGWIVGERKFLR
jgi:DNA-binding transcriptional ArsR family regulator